MIKKALAIAFASACMATASAAPTINPVTGLSGNVDWSTGIGYGLYTAMSNVFGQAGNSILVSAAVNSTIDFHIADSSIMGDAFALELDGIPILPSSGNMGLDSRGPDATSYFEAFFDDIFLSAGDHTFTLFVTDSCCVGGGTDAQFSGLTAVRVDPTDIPEPTSLALVGLGLLGGAMLRRRSRS